MQPQHVQDDLGSYVLGALEPDEAEKVENHLSICNPCKQAMLDYQRTADILLFTPAPIQIDTSLRAKVLSRVARESGAGEATKHQTPFSALLDKVKSFLGKAPKPLPEKDSITAAIMEILCNPTCHIWDIPGTSANPTATARFIGSPDQKTGALISHGLPAPDERAQYQIWLYADMEHVEAGPLFTFPPGGFGAAILTAERPIQLYQSLAVSLEPSSGSKTPTGEFVLKGSITTGDLA